MPSNPTHTHNLSVSPVPAEGESGSVAWGKESLKETEGKRKSGMDSRCNM